MKQKFVLASLVALSLAGTATAQVKINEVNVAGPGTDSAEFVELFGTGGASLNAYELVLINGTNGGVYSTIDLAGQTIPVDGYLVISGGASVANKDVTLVAPAGAAIPATNWIQNGDPDAVVLREKAVPTNIIDAVGYFHLHTAGVPQNASLPATSYEAAGTGQGGDDDVNNQTGTGASVLVANIPIGRYPDGTDTNNNYNDFAPLLLGSTPGTSNGAGISNTLPFTESFTAATGLTRVWTRFFTDIILETAGTAVPAGIPNSPDPVSPTQWASVKDNTGGGDENMLADFLAQDYHVEAYMYVGPITTLQPSPNLGAQYAMLRGRKNAGPNNGAGTNAGDVTSPIGGYGESHYALRSSLTTGTIEATKVVKGVETVVATVGPVSAGWHKLAMNFNGGAVDFFVDNAIIHSLAGEVPVRGSVSVAYRETDTFAGNNGSARTNFDALTVKAPLAARVADWSLFQE